MVVPTGVEVNEEDLKFFYGKYDHYSVRSSADIEDGEKNSFAGMFDSYLNVSPKDILVNIKKVKDSVNNNRLKEYIQVFLLICRTCIFEFFFLFILISLNEEEKTWILEF